MSERGSFRVDIKESTFENNSAIRRLFEYPDGSLDTEREYQSEEAAELDTIRLSNLGTKNLRLQPADHDSTDFQAYIVSTGRLSGGYGRTTRNSSSGWEYKRKVIIERDDFTCQECGALGGPEGNVQLHVDHIKPQFAGGSNDLENLRTVCRECHMSMHECTKKNPKATNGEISKTIMEVAEQSEVPAFERDELYDLLQDTLSTQVDRDKFCESLNTLIRFDNISHEKIKYTFERPFTDERGKREYNIYYLCTERLDESLLSYDGGLRYDGKLIKNGQYEKQKGRQTCFDEFY